MVVIWEVLECLLKLNRLFWQVSIFIYDLQFWIGHYVGILCV